MTDEAIRERLARVETEMRFMERKLTETHEMVKELHDIMTQAKGAKFAILALGGFGGFVAGFVANAAKLIPWFSSLPK